MAVPLREDFGEEAVGGVPIPDAERPMPAVEDESPARRSAFVRAAQAKRSRRPDLIVRANALEP